MEGSCRVVKDLLLPEEMGGGGVGSNVEDTGHKRGGLFSLGFPVRLHIHKLCWEVCFPILWGDKRCTLGDPRWVT